MLTRSDLLTVRDYFSEDEWDLIDAALSEFQDHFDTDEDAIVLNTLQSKLAGISSRSRSMETSFPNLTWKKS